MTNDSDRVPSGRLRRLARVAALGPRAGLALARDAVGRKLEADPGERLGELLYDTLGKLKGGSLKAGQMVALLADDLPEATAVRLGRLFSSAPALQWASVAEVIEGELGATPEQLFDDIEHEPFASASLGQVHRARLTDGTRVAVKVQYPGVAEAIEHDLDLIHGIVGTASGLLIDVDAYFRALREDTLAELDYRREARWLQRMAEVTDPWPDLVVPLLFADRSAERVLTAELLEGDTLHAHFERCAETDPSRELGFRVVRAVVGPLFRAGVINADAHPGNFMVLEGDKLGLLDFGAATEVPEHLVRGLAALVPALIDPTGHDLVMCLEAAGIVMRRPDRAILEELAALIAAPLRGRYDFANDRSLQRISQFKQHHPVAMLRFEGDPGLLPVFRALLGVYHALKHLRVEGDVGAHLLELTEWHRA